MKKISIVFMILSLLAAPAFALDLADNIEDFTLSRDVSGTYFSNGTQDAYAIYTAHAQGDKMYGSGSFVSEIYDQDYESGDLPSTAPTNYTSSAFGSSWTAR